MKINQEQLVELAEDAYNTKWADRVYGLQMFLAGNTDPLKKELDSIGLTAGTVTGGTKFWKEYLEHDVRDLQTGVHDHALISTRIMVQSVVYSEPEFLITIDDPLVKAYNEEWLRSRWRMGRWPSVFLDMGMTGYEPAGVAFCQIGMVPSGDKNFVGIRAINPLDCIYDPVNKNPADWEWFLFRNRYSRKRFLLRWTKALGEERAIELWDNYANKRGSSSSNTVEPSGHPSVIYEYEYVSEDEYMVILGDLCEGPVMIWDETQGWMESLDKSAGNNPFQCLNVSVWWDNYSPVSRRPVGKAEGTYRVVSQANLIEKRLSELVENSPPITSISTYHIQDKNFLEHIKAGKSIGEWGKPILTYTPDASRAINRIPQAEAGQTTLGLLARMDEKINASTGVQDAARGEGINNAGSERVTAYQIQQTMDMAGTQMRHMRHQFAAFLSDLCTKVRFIGAQFDTLGDTIWAEGIEFEGDIIPSAIMLEEPAFVRVTEDALLAAGKEGQTQKVMQLYTQAIIPFMSIPKSPMDPTPVVDPQKAFKTLMKRLGEADAENKYMSEDAAGMGMMGPQGMPMDPAMGGIDPQAQLNELAGTIPEGTPPPSPQEQPQ